MGSWRLGTNLTNLTDNDLKRLLWKRGNSFRNKDWGASAEGKIELVQQFHGLLLSRTVPVAGALLQVGIVAREGGGERRLGNGRSPQREEAVAPRVAVLQAGALPLVPRARRAHGGHVALDVDDVEVADGGVGRGGAELHLELLGVALFREGVDAEDLGRLELVALAADDADETGFLGYLAHLLQQGALGSHLRKWRTKKQDQMNKTSNGNKDFFKKEENHTSFKKKPSFHQKKKPAIHLESKLPHHQEILSSPKRKVWKFGFISIQIWFTPNWILHSFTTVCSNRSERRFQFRKKLQRKKYE